MLYISHRFPEVFANCDAVTVLRDGKHVKTLPMSSTKESEVVSLMVGRELLASSPGSHAPCSNPSLVPNLGYIWPRRESRKAD